jgi:hypothetical protein
VADLHPAALSVEISSIGHHRAKARHVRYLTRVNWQGPGKVNVTVSEEGRSGIAHVACLAFRRPGGAGVPAVPAGARCPLRDI